MVFSLGKKNFKDCIRKKDLNYDIVACGGVVVYQHESETLYLVLKHSSGKKHWALPKGHLENGESYLDCAVREIVEETGIDRDKLHFVAKLKAKSVYKKKRKFRKDKLKIVHLFLFKSMTTAVTLSKEHTNFKWLPIHKIKKKLTFPTSFPAFLEAHELMNNETKLINQP